MVNILLGYAASTTLDLKNFLTVSSNSDTTSLNKTVN